MGFEAQATGAMFVALMRTVASAIERLGETLPPHIWTTALLQIENYRKEAREALKRECP